MEIIFQGQSDGDEAIESLQSVIRLFKERYNIGHFREMHLSVTLVDDSGEDVELVDSKTENVYRIFEVYRETPASIHHPIKATSPRTLGTGQGNEVKPYLKLVIDNS